MINSHETGAGQLRVSALRRWRGFNAMMMKDRRLNILLFVELMLGIWCASASAMVYGTEEVARLQAEQAASVFTRLYFGITTTITLLMITFGIYRKRIWYVLYAIGLLLFGIVIIINDSAHWVVFYEVHGVGVQDGAAIAPLNTLLCLHIAAIIIGWAVFFLQTWCRKYAEDAERKIFDSDLPPA